MAITWTPTFGTATNSAFGAGTVTLSNVALGTGDALVYVYNNNGSNNGGTTSVTVAGVSASKLSATSDGTGGVWLATGVNAATENVSYSCYSCSQTDGMGTSACCGGIITGENVSSVVVTEYGNASIATGDPQQVTNTVPSGGLRVCGFGPCQRCRLRCIDRAKCRRKIACDGARGAVWYNSSARAQ